MFHVFSYDAGGENAKFDVKIEDERQNPRKDKNSKDHLPI